MGVAYLIGKSQKHRFLFLFVSLAVFVSGIEGLR